MGGFFLVDFFGRFIWWCGRFFAVGLGGFVGVVFLWFWFFFCVGKHGGEGQKESESSINKNGKILSS